MESFRVSGAMTNYSAKKLSKSFLVDSIIGSAQENSLNTSFENLPDSYSCPANLGNYLYSLGFAARQYSPTTIGYPPVMPHLVNINHPLDAFHPWTSSALQNRLQLTSQPVKKSSCEKHTGKLRTSRERKVVQHEEKTKRIREEKSNSLGNFLK